MTNSTDIPPRASWPAPRAGARLAVAGLVFLSGFWILLSSSWSIAYVVMLAAHPLLGAVWGTAVAVQALRRLPESEGRSVRLVRQVLFLVAVGAAALAIGTARGRAIWIPLALVALGAGFGLTLGLHRWTGDSASRRRVVARLLWAGALAAGLILAAVAPGPWAVGIGAAGIAAATAIAWRGEGRDGIERGLTHAVLQSFVLTWYSGLLILAMQLGRHAGPAFRLHRWSAAALVVAALAWVILRAARSPEKTLPTRRQIVATAAIASALAAAIAVDALLPRPTFRLHLSTIPNADRDPGERIDRYRVDRPELLALTRSCGVTADCHAGILQDHLGSVHNRSIQTPHFQRNLDAMVAEIGPDNANLCAGCHYPQALFDARLGYKDFARNDNMSCVYCHVVSDVEFPPDRGRSTLVLAPNLRHLAWLRAGPNGDTRVLVKLLINLDPRGHARALKTPIQSRDEICQACHRLQIQPTRDVGLLRSRCRDCHMQPRRDIGLEGKEANHLFPGTNAAVPFANGDMDRVQLTQRFASGSYPIRIQAWGQTSALDSDTRIRHWLEMHYETQSAVYPGRTFHFAIGTANNGVDHPFPAAPLDLIEVWLAVTLKDADGRALLESGRLDADFRVPPDAHRMGGYMIGKDGRLVERNRVWQIARKVVERQLAFGQRTSDAFEVELPQGVAGPLALTATWRYRKLNQDFVTWAYGPQRTMPIAEVASMSVTVPLDRDPSAVPAVRSWTQSAIHDQVVPPVHP